MNYLERCSEACCNKSECDSVLHMIWVLMWSHETATCLPSTLCDASLMKKCLKKQSNEVKRALEYLEEAPDDHEIIAHAGWVHTRKKTGSST